MSYFEEISDKQGNTYSPGEIRGKNLPIKKMNGIALVQIISALLIVNSHTSALAIPLLHHIAKFGFIFNTVFVFLSGYLLSQSLSTTPTYRNFLYKRINRIYPSLHIALIVIALIYLWTGHKFTINSFLLAATGFSYFFGDNTFGNHLWFVSVILVCYLVSIPTYYGLRRQPIAFFMLLLSISLIIVFAREGSFYGIYDKVSNNITYRFIYHYIVFSLAIYIGIIKDRNSYPGKMIMWLGLFGVLFPLYLWLRPNLYFNVIAIVLSILLAICIIQIIIMTSHFIEKHLSYVFLLSSVTYQLYLIHYSVIIAINGNYHGKFIGYPLVFLFSIALAFVVLMLAQQYERLTRRCTGWLLRYAP